MARVLGEGGRYLGQEANRKERNMFIIGCVAIGLLSWISGFISASIFHKTKIAYTIPINAIAALVATATWLWINRRLDALAKQRQNLRKER